MVTVLYSDHFDDRGVRRLGRWMSLVPGGVQGRVRVSTPCVLDPRLLTLLVPYLEVHVMGSYGVIMYGYPTYNPTSSNP